MNQQSQTAVKRDYSAGRVSAASAAPGAETAPLRILWVKVGGLWPLNTGGRLRSFHLLRELSATHEVTLLTTHGPDQDPQELARQLPNCRQVHSLPHTPAKKNSARFLFALGSFLAYDFARGSF